MGRTRTALATDDQSERHDACFERLPAETVLQLRGSRNLIYTFTNQKNGLGWLAPSEFHT